MKKFTYSFLISICCMVASNSNAQSNRWLWATQFSDSFENYSTSIITRLAIDPEQNILITGIYDPSFGMFISKINPDGQMLFENLVFYTRYNIYANEIIPDNNGNFFVAGTWEGHGKDDSVSFKGRKFRWRGGSDIYIVKFNKAGNILWCKSLGSHGDDYYGKMTLDQKGNLSVTISNSADTLYIDSSLIISKDYILTLTFDSVGLLKNHNSDYLNNMFQSNFMYRIENDTFKKYDLNNKLIYKSYTGLNVKSGYWMSENTKFSSKYIYLLGGYGKLQWKNKELYSLGEYDVMICKMDTFGKIRWLKTIGGKKYDTPINICIDSKENVFVVDRKSHGDSPDSVYFDYNTFVYGRGTFIVKYDSSGNLLYVDKLDNGCTYDMIIDKNDKLYFGGHLIDTLNFGFTVLTDVNNLFLAKYDTGFVSIYEHPDKVSEIEIFPNPSSSGNFNIVSDDFHNQELNITIYNLLGIKIRSYEVHVKDRLQVTIGIIPVVKGVYILNIIDKENNKSFRNKLIIN